MRQERLDREQGLIRILIAVGAIGLIVAAAVFNEVLIARYLSADGQLELSTIWTIRRLQAVLILGGITLLAVRPAPPRQTLVKWISVALCSSYILFGAWYAFGNPYNNWDVLPYTALAISYDQSDIDVIHDETYEAVREAGVDLTAGSEYWADMAANADHFHQQLPFYRIKPLYVWLMYLLHRAGISYVTATVVISLISAVCSFLIIAVWLSRFTSGFLWCFLAIFVAGVSGLIEVARLSTPDSLSAVFILAGLYLLIEKQRTIAAYSVLALSLLARPDNLILALVVMTYMNVFGPAGYRVKWRWLAVFIAAMLLESFTINIGSYGWWTLFAHSFFGWMNAPQEFSTPFTLSKYLSTLYSSFSHIAMLQTGWALLGVFLVLVAGSCPFRVRGGSVYLHIAVAMTVALLARLVLFPEWEDRFFVAYYAVSLIVFVAIWTERLNRDTGYALNY